MQFEEAQLQELPSRWIDLFQLHTWCNRREGTRYCRALSHRKTIENTGACS